MRHNDSGKNSESALSKTQNVGKGAELVYKGPNGA